MAEPEVETIDVEFLVFNMISLLLVVTTLLLSQEIQNAYLNNYSVLYTVLTLATIIGLFIYSSLYKYEWKFCGLPNALFATGVTVAALFSCMVVFSAFMQTPNVIGIPYVPEITVPEVPVEVQLTPGMSIAKGYLSLSSFLGVPLNMLVSAVLMFPSGFSESIFQTALPRLFKSALGESTAAEIAAVTVSNLIFAGWHYITYGFTFTVLVGTFIGGMALSMSYRYHKSEIGLGMGHTLYNLILLAMHGP